VLALCGRGRMAIAASMRISKGNAKAMLEKGQSALMSL
jgi:hypothetical protein